MLSGLIFPLRGRGQQPANGRGACSPSGLAARWRRWLSPRYRAGRAELAPQAAAGPGPQVGLLTSWRSNTARHEPLVKEVGVAG